MNLRHDVLKPDCLLRVINEFQALAIAATQTTVGALLSTYEFANLASSASQGTTEVICELGLV
jgi:hypothetical protein